MKWPNLCGIRAVFENSEMHSRKEIRRWRPYLQDPTLRVFGDIGFLQCLCLSRSSMFAHSASHLVIASRNCMNCASSRVTSVYEAAGILRGSGTRARYVRRYSPEGGLRRFFAGGGAGRKEPAIRRASRQRVAHAAVPFGGTRSAPQNQRKQSADSFASRNKDILHVSVLMQGEIA